MNLIFESSVYRGLYPIPLGIDTLYFWGILSEPDPDWKCISKDAGPQGVWIIRPVSSRIKNGEQSHIARGGNGEVPYMCGHFSI